jgi:hypothetical protein
MPACTFPLWVLLILLLVVFGSGFMTALVVLKNTNFFKG